MAPIASQRTSLSANMVVLVDGGPRHLLERVVGCGMVFLGCMWVLSPNMWRGRSSVDLVVLYLDDECEVSLLVRVSHQSII